MEKEAAGQDRKYTIKPVYKSLYTREFYMAKFFADNKSYLHAKETNSDVSGELLEKMKNRYLWYRAAWRGNPNQAIKENLGSNFVEVSKSPPLCIDIELSAMCDLACPFCYRQWIAT